MFLIILPILGIQKGSRRRDIREKQMVSQSQLVEHVGTRWKIKRKLSTWYTARGSGSNPRSPLLLLHILIRSQFCLFHSKLPWDSSKQCVFFLVGKSSLIFQIASEASTLPFQTKFEFSRQKSILEFAVVMLILAWKFKWDKLLYVKEKLSDF